MTQGQFLNGGNAGLNSEISFSSISCRIEAKEPIFS